MLLEYGSLILKVRPGRKSEITQNIKRRDNSVGTRLRVGGGGDIRVQLSFSLPKCYAVPWASKVMNV
jgi:hypothetical protein